MPKLFAELWLIVLLATPGLYCQWAPKRDVPNDLSDETCSLEELDHSTLIECDRDSICKDRATGYANGRDEYAFDLVHIYSSRDGDRLKFEPLQPMNLIEGEFARSFNINTTLTVMVSPSDRLATRKVHGFGATLNLGHLLVSLKDGSLSKTYKPLLNDFYSNSGAKASMLRLVLSNETVASQEIGRVIQAIDELLVDVMGPARKIELILDLGPLDWSAQVEESMRVLSESLGPVRAIDMLTLANNSQSFMSQKPNVDASDTKGTSMSVDTARRVRSFQEAVGVVEGKELASIRTLVIETESPSSYDILDDVRRSGNFTIITVTRPRARGSLLGDWHNAKDYAVEMLNHLKHGVNGVIEPSSVLNLLSEHASGNAHDASLYDLEPSSHGTHLRGPMYYAMSHFSRYLPRGSRLLEIDLFTQPNMFAAHYAAFLDPSGRIVTIVLNDNDHMLPFRLSVDGKIMAYTVVKQKSFNTFVLKQ